MQIIKIDFYKFLFYNCFHNAVNIAVNKVCDLNIRGKYITFKKINLEYFKCRYLENADYNLRNKRYQNFSQQECIYIYMHSCLCFVSKQVFCCFSINFI